MTKEELEKEITEYLNTQTLPKIDSLVYRVIKNLIFGFTEPREKRIAELEAQIEKMKSDVKGNIKWADENKNHQMYFKLNAMLNQWEIKENDL